MHKASKRYAGKTVNPERRKFCRSIVVSGLGAAGILANAALAGEETKIGPKEETASQTTSRPKKPLMHVGTQSFTSGSEEDLQFLKRHGVDNADGGQPRYVPGQGWRVEEILRKKERYEVNGISLDMLHLPLSSAGIDHSPMPNILLGKSPERDREIEDVCKMIETAARAGIHGLNYNLTILPVLRTGSSRGRGGSRYSRWVYEDSPNEPLTRAGRVPAGVFWERIEYFLERVIPAAGEHKVRMACHVADPGTAPGYRGVDRVLGTVEGLKRFVGICASPYHGLNFCIGSCAEALEEPGRQIYEVIRHFGRERKLFNIHLRNIRGRRDNFEEVYPDNGDIDMCRIMKVLRDTGYAYMVMPDHMPRHRDDPGGRQAFAFAFGYIKALIQAAYVET
jgi:mannonate dehydratase